MVALFIIKVNGESRELCEGTTVSGLLIQLDMAFDRVAVELNKTVISRSNWESSRLQEGDRVEIVHFVGGGESFE